MEGVQPRVSAAALTTEAWKRAQGREPPTAVRLSLAGVEQGGDRDKRAFVYRVPHRQIGTDGWFVRVWWFE
jgi:hypothetical protein